MKKLIALLLAAVMVCSLAACGADGAEGTSEMTEQAPTETETVLLTKEEMLAGAKPLTREEIEKSIGNLAFAKSLAGNIYTFGGDIWFVEEDHAVVTFYLQEENSNYATAANVMVAHLYLPLEELISLENHQRLSFVGRLDDVSTHDETIPDWGTQTVIDLVFGSAAIVADRFEETGTLHSQNASYGADAWNIRFPGNDYLAVVHFREDVSAYQGQEITYSYKVTGEGRIDAYIVE